MGVLVRMYGFDHGPINPDVHPLLYGLSRSRRPVIQFLNIRENNHANPLNLDFFVFPSENLSGHKNKIILIPVSTKIPSTLKSFLPQAGRDFTGKRQTC
jgi:hypothetical protein